MSKRIVKLFCAFLLLSALVTSCKKEEAPPVAPAAQGEEVDAEELRKFLSQSWGAKLEDIVLQKNDKVYNDDVFIVEGDIVFTRQDITARYKKAQDQSAAGGRVQQRRFNYLVSASNVEISVSIDANMNMAWQTAVRDAMREWNSLRVTHGFSIHFSEVSPSEGRVTPDIIVNGTTFADPIIIAEGSAPTSNGQPGSRIQFDENPPNPNMTPAQRLYTATHELGHCIGFAHTDPIGGIYIQGTPVTDPASIMNQGDINWAGFSSGDLQAAQLLYPATLLSFKKQTGFANDIGIGAFYDEKWIAGVTSTTGGYTLYYRSGNITDAWTLVNFAGVRIDVDNQGLPWVVNSNNQLLKRNANNSWAYVTHSAADVGVGAENTVYMVGIDDVLYRTTAAGATTPVSNTGVGSIKRVSVDPVGNPWVINLFGQIFRRVGSTWQQLSDLRFKDVGVGADGTVYGIRTDNTINFWDGDQWVAVAGAGIAVDTDLYGNAWIINANKEIYRQSR